MELLRQLNNLSSASSSPASLSPALLLAALRAHGWRINTEEQDAHEMLHVVMTTIEEELEFRKADAKPSHASLLDISNIGLENDDDSDEMEEASPAGGPFAPGRFVSFSFYLILLIHLDSLNCLILPICLAGLPGESRCLPLLQWKSLQGIHGIVEGQSLFRGIHLRVGKGDSPGMYRLRLLSNCTALSFSRLHTRRRSNSGVMCKLGSELPSNVVSSFTKPKCQTPFTGLITCKVKNDGMVKVCSNGMLKVGNDLTDSFLR